MRVVSCTYNETGSFLMLKFIASTAGIIFLVGLVVIIGLLMLIF